MAKTGWIKLHRQITESTLYKEPRKFSRSEAWIDLLLRANHEESTETICGKEIFIPSGSCLTYLAELAKAWGWDYRTVDRFISYLFKENMVSYDGILLGRIHGRLLTIENWAIYQGGSSNRGSNHGSNSGSKNRVSSIIEEEKNILSLAEFVSMPKNEAEKLIQEFGMQATKDMVEILNNYKGSTGKKYKSDYRAILSWVVKRYQEDKQKGLFSSPELEIPH